MCLERTGFRLAGKRADLDFLHLRAHVGSSSCPVLSHGRGAEVSAISTMARRESTSNDRESAHGVVPDLASYYLRAGLRSEGDRISISSLCQNGYSRRREEGSPSKEARFQKVENLKS